MVKSAFALIASALLTCCAASTARPAGVPSGNGWYCFTPHPDGSRATSCHRSRDACVRSIADAMEDARRHGEIASYSSCAPHAEVWCLAIATDAAVCIAQRADCERLVSDLDDVHASCTSTR